MRTGTTSKILWHFTGGPEKGSGERKEPEKAYSNLKGILSTKELKLGRKAEVVEQRTSVEEVVFVRSQATTRISCLAEIPIQHLDHHKERYGKFAIGFYRDSAIDAGYRPVLYALLDDWVVKNLMDKADDKTLSLVKTYRREDLETIYAEREWRSMTPYEFEWQDVAMVLLPREYLKRLLSDLPSLPRHVPVLSYEDALLH